MKGAKIEEMMEDGIKYSALSGQEYTWYEVFNFEEEKEAFAFLDYNAVAVNNSLYDYIVCDSKIESEFAASLDNDEDVKLFSKIPPRFKIDTPIGSYNPDWAVCYECGDDKKLYFVIETKDSTDEKDLRSAESFKIRCGKEHFNAIDTGIQFKLAKTWRGLNK